MSKLLCLLTLLPMLAGCAAIAPDRTPSNEGLTDTKYMKEFAHIEWQEIGRSVEDRPIYMTAFGSGDDVTLFFSCFHGGERSTPRFAFEFADYLHRNPERIQPGKRVVIVPIQNPDGFVRGTRNNARNVDLNRNYPTLNWGLQQDTRRQIAFGEAPASEPETRLVLKLVAEIQPTKILSVHQPIRCNNPDGPAGMGLARLLGEYNDYPLEPYIGFPTPGSFGTWAGKEHKIPMVTLELPPGQPYSPEFDQMWEDNREGRVAFVNSNLDELDNSE